MPKREVRPVKVIHHGKVRWRVFIPRVLTGGVRKTRWFNTESEAKKFCAETEANRRAERTGIEALPFEDRARVMACLRKLGCSVDTLVAAAEAYLQRQILTDKTIYDVAQACLDAKRAANLRKKYVDSLANTFRRFCEVFRDRTPSSVAPAEIATWLRSGGWEPITQQSYLKDIRTLYAYAVANHYAHDNPARAVQRPKAPRKPPGILTVADMERLLRAVEAKDSELVPRLALVAFGGLRPDEAARTESRHVRNGHIDLPPDRTKNNVRRLVQITPTLEAWLKAYPIKPITNWRKRWDAVRASIAPPIEMPHDVIRHSFCSYAVPVYGIAQTALMADHSEDVLKRHYLERVTAADAKQFWSIRP